MTLVDLLLFTYACREQFPREADYVIIGSGITGAFIALDLSRTLAPDTRILILEARDAVSGATGRNGTFWASLSFLLTKAVH